MQPSEEIKLKLNIVDILGGYIKLIPAGSNYRAVCPFHTEKSPSLMVSEDKQIWRCFGCAKGGDIFSFVMEIESLSFIEALRSLADKAGVTLEKTNPKLNSEKNRALDVLDIASRYYCKILLNSEVANKALEYAVKRGLTEDLIEEWRVGYSPNSWDDLYLFLKKKGFSDADMLLAGLVLKKDQGNGYYNRFRGRIMFPIKDQNGSVVAFTARVSPENEATEKMGKYINSPQTILYDKSKIIFGLDKAKLSIKKEDLIIVVEGQMDVITAHANGFKNIIATSGTALTVEQVTILKRYSLNIAFAFDADSAGKMATERAIDEAMRHEMNVSVIEVPHGKDPDDCIKNNPDDWVTAVKGRISAMDFYFKEYLTGLDLNVIGDKRIAVKKILPKIFKITDAIEKDFWLKDFSNRIDVKEVLLRETLAKLIASENSPKPVKMAGDNKAIIVQVAEPATRQDKLYDDLIGLLIKFPYLIEVAINKLPAECIYDGLVKDLYTNVLIYYNSNTNMVIDSKVFYVNFRSFINESKSVDFLNMLDRIAMQAEISFESFDDSGAKNEFLDIVVILKKKYIESEMKLIERSLNKAEQEKDANKIQELMSRFNSLSNELRTI
ncbi:DNA primase [Patescibacteria group bacterium]|nr:DNA primase [Patescibacteria group bacterium]